MVLREVLKLNRSNKKFQKNENECRVLRKLVLGEVLKLNRSNRKFQKKKRE